MSRYFKGYFSISRIGIWNDYQDHNYLKVLKDRFWTSCQHMSTPMHCYIDIFCGTPPPQSFFNQNDCKLWKVRTCTTQKDHMGMLSLGTTAGGWENKAGEWWLIGYSNGTPKPDENDHSRWKVPVCSSYGRNVGKNVVVVKDSDLAFGHQSEQLLVTEVSTEVDTLW